MQLTLTDEQQQKINKVKALVDKKKYVDKNDIIMIYECNEKKAMEIMRDIAKQTDLIIKKKGTSNVLTTKDMTTKEKTDFIIENAILTNISEPTEIGGKYELTLNEQTYNALLTLYRISKICHIDDAIGLRSAYCIGNKYDVWLSFVHYPFRKDISLRRMIIFYIDDDSEETKESRLKLYNSFLQSDTIIEKWLNENIKLNWIELKLIKTIDYDYSKIFG
jgi:hypothetical protein